MQSNLKKDTIGTVWLLVIAAVVAHLVFYRLPSVNGEWAFADAARYFETHNQDFLDRYFSVQANSLGIPLCAYLIHQIFPAIDIGLLPRLLAISGFIFLGAALVRLNDRTGKCVHPVLLAALVFLNPLVWTFGGRGTADFFPAAMALYSLSLFWDKHPTRLKLTTAILIFGIAVTLKYHVVTLLPLLWLEAITRPDRGFKTAFQQMSLVTIAVLVIPALYVYAVKQEFGFWLTPPPFQNGHSLTFRFSFAVSNFISYAGYLALLLLPLSLLPLWKRIRTPAELAKILAAAVVLFLAGYFLIESNAEMNFGPLDAYLSAHFVGGIFCVSASLFFLVMKDGLSVLRDDNEVHRILVCIMLGIVIFIGVLSFTRPAQRYLLFVLPLAYLFIASYLNTRKTLTVIIIFLCMLTNVYITLSQYATGQAALALTQRISESGLIAVTNPEAILGDTGNAFPVNARMNKKYIVIVGQSPRQLFYAESSPAPFIHKVFSVVPQESPAAPYDQ
jgi:hypothetical protein